MSPSKTLTRLFLLISFDRNTPVSVGRQVNWRFLGFLGRKTLTEGITKEGAAGLIETHSFPKRAEELFAISRSIVMAGDSAAGIEA